MIENGIRLSVVSFFGGVGHDLSQFSRMGEVQVNNYTGDNYSSKCDTVFVVTVVCNGNVDVP